MISTDLSKEPIENGHEIGSRLAGPGSRIAAMPQTAQLSESDPYPTKGANRTKPTFSKTEGIDPPRQPAAVGTLVASLGRLPELPSSCALTDRGDFSASQIGKGAPPRFAEICRQSPEPTTRKTRMKARDALP